MAKKDVHDEKHQRGYRCYDGNQLLLFDYDEVIHVRDTSTMTEQTYLDKEKQIASFIRSGERLQNFRRSEFDYPDGEVPDDVMPDPTAALGFDLADASALQKKLASKAGSSVLEGDTDPQQSETQSKDAASEPESAT